MSDKNHALLNLENWMLLEKTATTGSLSRAASELGLSLSIASRRISDMEKNLGFQVLNRKVKPVCLSDHALELLPVIKTLVSTTDLLLSSASNRANNREKIYKISIPVNLSRNPYLTAISAFRQDHPEIRVEIFWDARPEDVLSGVVDIAYFGVTTPSPSLYAEKLPINASFLMASRSYIKNFGEPKKIDDLINHTLLIHNPPKNGCWLRLENGEENYTVDQNHKILFEDALSNKSRVIAGEGIATDLVPAFLGNELASGQVVPVLKGWHRTWYPHLVCLKGREKEKEIQQLMNLIQKAYRVKTMEHWTFWYRFFQIPLSTVKECHEKS